jgi:hypothetical protein
VAATGPVLRTLLLGDEPARWEALGFAVAGGRVALGGVTLVLGGGGGGIGAWRLDCRSGDGPIDGLAEAAPVEPPAAQEHPNGAIALDHVVVATPDLARTIAALEQAGLELRRTRDTSLNGAPLRQAFFVAREAVVEVTGPPGPAGDGPARFWGLTVVVSDLDAAAAALGPLLGEPRDAVQPGRRIATVRAQAGLGTRLALMSPRA